MIHTKTILEQVVLPDGSKLVVYGFNGDMRSIPDDEHYRNIELLRNGQVVWRVAAKGESHSRFVGINVSGNKYEAVDFDGIAYALDIETGGIELIGWVR